MQRNIGGSWSGICPFGTILFTILVIIIVSCISTYIPPHDFNDVPDNVFVPPSNLTLAFETNISQASANFFNSLTIVNTNDIARQLESAFYLRRKSLTTFSAKTKQFLTDGSSRKRRLVGYNQATDNNTKLILQASINYLVCGRINSCKIKLYNRVSRSITDYQNGSFPIILKFNNGIQLTTDVIPYMLNSVTTTESARIISQNVNKCSESKLYDLFDTSIEELQNGLKKNHFTSVDLVKTYIARINEVNLKGPTLRAVLEISPTALKAAEKADALRKKGTVLSPLHGIPILLKDTIATRPEDGMDTTAGSFALLGSITPGDATVAKKLRDAGAILLGKAALSEWANFRGFNIPNGWSGRGKQATSAFYPQGDACGSSTGSGIASSIGLAAGALGTETDGSITCPSNRNNLVGIKPTVGLTSRNLIIPLSQHQDTNGPMCRSVADAAAILSIIAGRDSADNYTLSQPKNVPDYTQHLKKDGLKNARIGVLRKVFANSTFNGYPDYIVSEFNKTIKEIFKKLGATIIDPADLATADELVSNENELIVLAFEFKQRINGYLSQLKSIPTNVTNLQDLINYNIAHRDLELPPGRDNQELFLIAQNTTNLQDPIYINAVAVDLDLGRTRGIDAILEKYKLDALIAPSEGRTSNPAALAGYPIITVPLGFLPDTTPVMTNENTTLLNLPIWPAPNFPFGISFIGTAYSEARLIELAYSYEQATLTGRKGKPFKAAIPKTQLSDIVCSQKPY